MNLRDLRNDVKALREQVAPRGGVRIVIRRTGETEVEALGRQGLHQVPGLKPVVIELSDDDLRLL